MIEITEMAQSKLNEYFKQNSLDSAVRIYLNESCCGASLALSLDEARDTDASVENGGLTYLINKELSSQVGKVTVDYLEQDTKSGFSVSSENPVNTGSSCGPTCSCC